MLYGGDGVALLVAAHPRWPLDICAPGVDDPEGGLIRKHYSLTVLLSLVKTLLGK